MGPVYLPPTPPAIRAQQQQAPPVAPAFRPATPGMGMGMGMGAAPAGDPSGIDPVAIAKSLMEQIGNMTGDLVTVLAASKPALLPIVKNIVNSFQMIDSELTNSQQGSGTAGAALEPPMPAEGAAV